MSIDRVWEDIHSSREWGKYPSEAVIRFIARNYYMSVRKNVKILDFGCGQGANTWYLSKEGFDTYAFDGAESAVRRAKEYLHNDKLDANIKVMDGVSIDYEDSFFDAVIDSACIGHSVMANIIRMYEEVYRVLKSGGKFYTSFFSDVTTGFGQGELIEPRTYRGISQGPLAGEGVTHFWTQEELKNTLEQVGFIQVKIDKMKYESTNYTIENLNAVCVKI